MRELGNTEGDMQYRRAVFTDGLLQRRTLKTQWAAKFAMQLLQAMTWVNCESYSIRLYYRSATITVTQTRNSISYYRRTESLQLYYITTKS